MMLPVCCMGDYALGYVLSYVVQPQLLSTLCSVCRAWNVILFTPCAWCGTIVDTANFKPVGANTLRHYDLWLHALAVVTQGRMSTTVWFALAATCRLYRWFIVVPPTHLTISPNRTALGFWMAHAGSYILLGTPVDNNIKILVTGDWRTYDFFFGLTTSRDPTVVATLYLDAPESHDESEETLHGCTLAADGITFRQGAVRERFALPMPALKMSDRVVLSFTVADKALQFRFGNDPPVVMTYDGSPPVVYYPVVVCVPGSLCQLPRVDPCACDNS